jgi:GMP synthase (glutamine-hydrolysing)
MILVLDNEVDSDYRYLGPEIVHYIEEAEYRVYHEAHTDVDPASYAGLILTGSTASVYDPDHADWVAMQSDLIRRCIDEAIPMLGICFGHQLVNQALGGTVQKDRRRSTFVRMEQLTDDPILDGVEPLVPVLHSDVVTELGEGLVPTAQTEYNDYFCTCHESAPLWTVQFHPEFTDRVDDRPTDWDPGEGSFASCTATQVLSNFEKLCEGK